MAFNWKKLLGIVAPIVGGIFGGPAGAAIGGAVGGGLQGGKPSQWIPNALLGAGMGYGGAKLTGIGGGGGNPLKSLGGMFGSSNPSPMITTGNTMNQALSGVRQSMTQQSSRDGFSKNPLLLGLGTMLGSQLITSPRVPELPESVLKFQEASKTGTALQNQAQQVLSQQLNTPFEQMSAEEEAAIRRNYDQSLEDALKNNDSLFRSLRPGSPKESDSSWLAADDRIRREFATASADALASSRRQIRNDFLSQRANTISQSLGLGQQQLAQLAQLSEIDYKRVMDQFGLDDRDSDVLRQFLLELGSNIFLSQYPQQYHPLYGSQN